MEVHHDYFSMYLKKKKIVIMYVMTLFLSLMY